MKLKKIIISALIMLTITNFASKCYAKYVIEITKKAVEININI